MQPYFLPYAGYFQLIGAVERFVVYDNVKYTKKGWINRNRMLRNGKDVLFTLPLKAASDSLNICERELALDFDPQKLLNQFAEAYRRAPFFTSVYSLLGEILHFSDRNLFRFIHHSIIKTCDYLGIRTPIVASSEVPIDHTLRHLERVLALCDASRAEVYINAIGGTQLYSKEHFQGCGIKLKFVQSRPFVYQQFGMPFVPALSIVDLLMFNGPQTTAEYVASGYDLI